MAAPTLLLILGLAVAWAQNCPCPAPDVNYCNSSVTFSNTQRVTCTSFGRGHINTFDGLAYDFREFGDFWLVSTKTGQLNANFFVQVRQISCTTTQTQTVPIAGQSAFTATCNSVFVIGSSAEYVEVSHTLNSESLNVLRNTVPVSFSAGNTVTLPLGTQVLVQPVKYVNAYQNLWRDTQPFLPNADFYVKITATNGIITEVYFYSSGEATVQVHLTNPATVGTLAGLCGFPDGCPYNDLYILPSSPFTPSANALDNAEPYISEVHTTSPGQVLAGALVNGDRFISNLAQPTRWVPYFATTWRIASSAEMFSNTAENYNIRYYQSNYNTVTGVCAANYPAYLNNACTFDVDNGNDPDKWETLISRNVMVGYCLDYCTYGTFLYHNTQLQPYQCNGICQYPDGSLPDLNQVFGPNNPPPTTVQQQPGGGAVLFQSTLNLEGTYFLNLATTDFCETRYANVSRTIKCSKGISVQTPQTRYVQAVNGYGGWPRVWLQANIDNTVSNLEWQFLLWPGMNDGFAAPVLWNAISALPYFTPQFAGTYVLNLAMYNGCQLKQVNFTIVAECASCAPSAQIALPSLKEVIWGMNFNSASPGPTLNTPSNIFPDKQLNADYHTPDSSAWGALGFSWQISDDDFTYNALEQIVAVNPNTYNVQLYPNTMVRDFAVANPAGNITSTSSSMGSSIGSPVVGATQGPPITLAKLTGPIGTQYGVFPPQREYPITRNIYRIPTTTTTQSWLNTQTVFQTADFTVPCVLSFPTGSAMPSPMVDATPQPTGNAQTDFTVGQLCVRDYNLNLTVGQPYCNFSSDVQLLQVECGPLPEAFVDCVQAVQYDFPTQTWPAVLVDGSQSMDPYGRGPILYNWEFQSLPSSSSLVNTALCGAPYNCLPQAFFVPDAPGTYNISLDVSNGCESASDSTLVTAWCTTPALTAGFTVNPPTLDYSSAVAVPFTTGVQLTSTAVTASGGPLTFFWTFTAPTSIYNTMGFIPDPVPPPAVTFFTQATPFYQPVLGGPYTFVQNVTHGCNQFQTFSVGYTVTCNQAINVQIDLNGGGSSITVTYVANVGFPSITASGAGTTFSPQGSPPVGTVTTQNYQWYVNGTFFSGGQTIVYNAPSFTPGVQVFNLFADDGCQYQMGTGQVTYVCLAKVISVTTTPPPNSAVPSLTTINLDGSASSNYAGLSYLWTLTGAPSRNTATIQNANTMIATFTPSVMTNPGEYYNITFTVCDLCSCNSALYQYTVVCTSTLQPVATVTYPVIGAPAVFWNNSAFARVELDGSQSNLGGRAFNDPTQQFVYTWSIVGAPITSIFSVISMTTTSGPLFSNSSSGPTSDGNYSTTTSNYNQTTTNTSTSYQVFLVNSNNINSLIPFPSCMYPDIEGSFQVQLQLQDYCQVSTTTTTVNSQCQGSPSIVSNVTSAAGAGSYVSQAPDWSPNAPSYNVSLSRAGARRVVLDASASQGYTYSRLEYYWSWSSPDPRAGTANAQANIDQPYGAMAAVDIQASGYYYINLTVHDGCAVSYQTITLYASCSPLAVALTYNAALSVTTGGPSSTSQQTFFIQETSQADCAYSNTWMVYNFSSSTSASVPVPNTASMASPSFFAFLIMALFTLLRL